MTTNEQIAAAVKAEREENCAAICWRCKEGKPLEQRINEVTGYRYWWHPPYANCSASPIRQRAYPQPTIETAPHYE
jgi:hypothetical protein